VVDAGAGWSAQVALDSARWPVGARDWPWDRRLAWWIAAQPDGFPTVGEVIAVISLLMGTGDDEARKWLLEDWGPDVLHAADGDTIIQELRQWGQCLVREHPRDQPDTTGRGWVQDERDPTVWGQGQPVVDLGLEARTRWGTMDAAGQGVLARLAASKSLVETGQAVGMSTSAVEDWVRRLAGWLFPPEVHGFYGGATWLAERLIDCGLGANITAYRTATTTTATVTPGPADADTGGHRADTGERSAKRRRTDHHQEYDRQQARNQGQGLGGAAELGRAWLDWGLDNSRTLQQLVDQVSERTGVPGRDVELWVWAAHPHQPTAHAAYHALQQQRRPSEPHQATAGHRRGRPGERPRPHPRLAPPELTDRQWLLVAAAKAYEAVTATIARKLGVKESTVVDQLDALADLLDLDATAAAVLPLLKARTETPIEAERLRPPGGIWPTWPPPKPQVTEHEWDLVAAAKAGETRLVDIAGKLGINESTVSNQLTELASNLGLNATSGAVLPLLKAKAETAVEAERLRPPGGIWPTWPPPKPPAKPLTEREWLLVAAAKAKETRPTDIANKLRIDRPTVSSGLTRLANKLGLNATGGAVLPLLKAKTEAPIEAERLRPPGGIWPTWPPLQTRTPRKRHRDENPQ